MDDFKLIGDKEIKTYFPDIDFFLQKINSLEYFSMLRFADWWWEALFWALQKIPHSKNGKVINNGIINAIAQTIVHNKRNHAYDISKKTILESVRITTRKPAQNMLFTVKAKRHSRRKVVKTLTKRDEFLYAHSWREYASTGEIHRLFEENPDYHFIMVGPFFYKNFGRKISLKNYHFVEISERSACHYADKTIRQVINVRNKIESDKVICLFSAGGISPYLITKIHERINKTFLIDIGRALDIYYCHDHVLLKGPGWRWSKAWFGPPIPSKMAAFTRWTRKYRT